MTEIPTFTECIISRDWPIFSSIFYTLRNCKTIKQQHFNFTIRELEKKWETGTLGKNEIQSVLRLYTEYGNKISIISSSVIIVYQHYLHSMAISMKIGFPRLFPTNFI
jgi:hypothetical protein